MDKKTGKTVGMIKKPVNFLIEKFNSFMRKLEKALKKEKVYEIDGFLKELVEEAEDAEKGLFSFFGELLFIHNLTCSLPSLENEVVLFEILGERIKQFLKPDFIVIYVMDKEFLSLYSYPDENISENLKEFGMKEFKNGKASIYENKEINGEFYNFASIPLRTTSEKIGIMLIGRKKIFREDEIVLVMAGATIVSFMLLNIKLNQERLKNERLITIGEVISGLSHDIRSIMTNLEGGINLLQIGIMDKDMELIKEAGGMIKRSYEKIKDLVLSMVDYSKKKEPELVLTDLNGLIEENINSNSEIFEEKKIKVKKKLDEKLEKIYIDPHRIDRMITNLVLNAVDAVEEGKGEIEIGTKYFPEEKVVHIWVKDNGCGIPERDLDKIFDIFYSTKGSRGTGFGLAIVEKIVKEHNGKIEVDSKLGKGTKFLIKLPVKQ